MITMINVMNRSATKVRNLGIEIDSYIRYLIKNLIPTFGLVQ